MHKLAVRRWHGNYFFTMDRIISRDIVLAEGVIVKARFVTAPEIAKGVWRYASDTRVLTQRFNGTELRYVVHTHCRATESDTFIATPLSDGRLSVRRVVNLMFVPDPSYRNAPSRVESELDTDAHCKQQDGKPADGESDEWVYGERELGDDAMHLDAVEEDEMIHNEEARAMMQTMTNDEVDAVREEQLIFLQRDKYTLSEEYTTMIKLADAQERRECRLRGGLTISEARHNADPDMSYKI